jgi:WhiB family redox-sensing transcriptional regulator
VEIGSTARPDVVDSVETSTGFASPPGVDRPSPIDRLIRSNARCYDPRGAYSRLFHSDDGVDIARAQAMCARCPVREPCLARAIERREPCGVWGGEILHRGAIVGRPRRPGRPPVQLVRRVVDEVTGVDLPDARCRDA